MGRTRTKVAPRGGTADMLMSRSSAVRRRLCNNPNVSIDYIEASGDCFYLAVEAALREHNGWRPIYAVSTMRDLVASSLTEEIFQLYVLLHTEKAEGFHFMAGVDSLDALRKRVRLRGQKVGAHKCVWADGFAMETIANHFQLLLLVIDERSDSLFTRIAPATSSSSQLSNAAHLNSEQSTVLLHASRREHMNLIIYKGKKMQTLGDLPLEIQKCWGICVERPRKVAAAEGASTSNAPATTQPTEATSGVPRPTRPRDVLSHAKMTQGKRRKRKRKSPPTGSEIEKKPRAQPEAPKKSARHEARAAPIDLLEATKHPEGAPSRRTRAALAAILGH